MTRDTRRTGLTGSAFIRLMARLAGDIPEPRDALPDRLGQWLDWTDAISLSTALDSGAGSRAAASHGPFTSLAEAEATECDRARRTLRNALADDTKTRALDAATDFSALRRYYVTRQQAIEDCVGSLRARLRAKAAAGSPALARLAAVDEVMERALGRQERTLLAAVPSMLQRHFDRLRKAHAGQPETWLDDFRQDFHEVLLAELDFRMQPIDGLIGALRHQPGRTP